MTLDQLVASEFVHRGEWGKDESGGAACRGDIPDIPGLYLFTVGSAIRYVGVAHGSLRSRMRSYLRRQRDRRLTRPVHQHLAETIQRGVIVDIYMREVEPYVTTQWRSLPVNVMIGVEAALIAVIAPAWNRRGRVRLLDGETVTDGSDPD